MKSRHYRNIICACSAVFVFINMGLVSTAFTVFYPYFCELRGFNNTQVQVITTIRNFFAVLSMQFAVRFYDKFDIRRGVALCLANTVAANLILCLTTSPLGTYLGVSMFGFSYGVGSMLPASILIRRWFPDHTGEALGIVAAGTGFSSFLLPFYAHFAVTRFGLSGAFAGEAVILAVLGTICILLIRNYPEKSGQDAAKAPVPETQPEEPPVKQAAGPVLSFSEDVRIRVFVFFTGVLCLSAAASLSMLERTTGHEMAMVSRLVSTFGIFLIIGKIGYGTLADKIGNFPSTVLLCTLNILAMFLCTLFQDASFGFMLVTMMITAVGFSLGTVGISIVASDFSTPESYPAVLKRWQSLYSFGGLLTGVVPGIIADVTGSYIPAYHIFFLIAVLSFILLIPIYARVLKARA